jgi:hypothetical protein
VGPDGFLDRSGGSSEISITHPMTGYYCVVVTPNPGVDGIAPVVASPTSYGHTIVDVINYTYSTICPGEYGVITLGLSYAGSWEPMDAAFVVAVL